MGLKSTFQNAAQSIISAFGDVSYTNLAYHSLGTFGYDPATGGNTESGGSDVTITAIPDAVSSRDVQDRDILMTDQKLLVANKDISVTPKVGDYTTIDGNRWNVLDWITDPAEALYEIFIRKM